MNRNSENKLDTKTLPSIPVFKDVGVIGIVPDKWGGPWQSRHHVLTRLAKYFNVVWINPARNWHELWFHGSISNQVLDRESVSIPGFIVYTPQMWLPQLYRPHFLARFTVQQRLSWARHILITQGCRTIVLYLWRPEYRPALKLLKHDLSCYHIDDEYSFSDSEQPIDQNEKELILLVNQVMIHSPALLEKKGKLNPFTTFIPNGVDYNAFATSVSEPMDLRAIPHPRIGYVGIIKKQLDLTLLITLAQRHQEWSFVLVGPQGYLGEHAVLLQKLSHMPNVFFLGGKPVAMLPAYTQHLDVCMLCYEVNDYTKFIYPMKLHEYLASGRPVVGAPIRSLQEFAHIITLCETPDDWSSALAEAIAPMAQASAQIEARRQVARQYDWDRLVWRIAYTLCSRLGSIYLERFEQLPLTYVQGV